MECNGKFLKEDTLESSQDFLTENPLREPEGKTDKAWFIYTSDGERLPYSSENLISVLQRTKL